MALNSESKTWISVSTCADAPLARSPTNVWGWEGDETLPRSTGVTAVVIRAVTATERQEYAAKRST